MEGGVCSNESDHCTYMLYDIIQEDCPVSSSGDITAMDFDELGTICTVDSQPLLPSHHPYVSFDGSDQIHEESTLGHTDSHGVVIQHVVEEDTNVNDIGEINGDTLYTVNNSDSRQSASSSEASNSHIEYVQNVVMSCCYMCGRNFTRLQILKGHMKRQHGAICDVSQVTKQVLPVATVCRQCGYIGASQRETRLHVIQKHRLSVARPPRQCKTNQQRLLLNRRRMAAEKAAYPPVVCLICRTEIGLLKNYDAHIKRYHQNDPKFAEALNDVRRIRFERTRSGNGIILNCEACGEPHDENRLIPHIRWKHSHSVNVKQLINTARMLIRSSKQQHMSEMRCAQVSCPHCGRCLRQISLANHVKFYCTAAVRSTAAVSVTPGARHNVECTICGQSMPRQKLCRHRRQVHRIGVYKQIETFACEYCPCEFTEAHQLRAHVKKHTGELMIICLLCYRNFTLNSVYREHFRRVHCAEFRFSCSSCGRGFWKVTTLRQHVCVPDEKERNTGKIAVLTDKMQQLKALNKPLFATVSPYKSDAAADSNHKDDADNNSYAWICLLCKLPFKNHRSYKIHYDIKHTTQHSWYKHSCAHCGRQFRQSRQQQEHKCRPENYASNVHKEMRQRNCRNSAQYIGPMFVTVPRHDDILDIVGDIFSHASHDDDDDDDDDDTCNDDSVNSNIS